MQRVQRFCPDRLWPISGTRPALEKAPGSAVQRRGAVQLNARLQSQEFGATSKAIDQNTAALR